MRQTKSLALATGIIFFLTVVFSGTENDAAAQKRQLQILLIAAGVSQVTFFFMAKDLEKKFDKFNIIEKNNTD